MGVRRAQRRLESGWCQRSVSLATGFGLRGPLLSRFLHILRSSWPRIFRGRGRCNILGDTRVALRSQGTAAQTKRVQGRAR